MRLNIDFKIISHGRHRYDTVGDYWRKKSGYAIRVSRMSRHIYSVLVFLHELIELMICLHEGISLKEIDEFDMMYEATRPINPTLVEYVKGNEMASSTGRAPCGHPHFEEPGDDPHAPYHHAHIAASRCEHIIAQVCGVDWDEYCKEVDSLEYKVSAKTKGAA